MALLIDRQGCRISRRFAIVAVTAMVTALAGCSSGSSSNTPKNGGTFTMAFGADPGSLDPQKTLDGTALSMAAFAYDPLVSQTADGTFVSALAASWKQAGSRWTFKLNDKATCSDGTRFTADDVVSNIEFIENAKSGSPLLGTYLPAGVAAKVTEPGTVTLTTKGNPPFFLNGLALVPMVCKAGMADRKTLLQGSEGTGPFKLTQAASGSQYTYAKRSGYAWGPGGATNGEAGSPTKAVFKIVPSASTQANLLLSGSINAASVSTADQKRLKAKKLFSAGYVTPLGEMFFNQGAGHVTEDTDVRKALTTALDLAQLRSVYTAGGGTAPKTFTPGNPAPCPGDSISAALPSASASDAGKLLDAAGWKPGPDGIRTKAGKELAITLQYSTDLVPGAQPAAELAAEQWKKIGVKVKLLGQTVAKGNTVLFGTGAWEVAWSGLGVPTPNFLVGVLSGAAPPEGSNFGHIDNATYDREAKAAQKPSKDNGCSHWLAAETALVENSDVVPFADFQYPTYGSKARFDYVSGNLVPTSIRLTN